MYLMTANRTQSSAVKSAKAANGFRISAAAKEICSRLMQSV